MSMFVPFERSISKNKACESCKKDCKLLTLVGLVFGVLIGLATAATYNFAFPSTEPLLTTGEHYVVATVGFFLFAVPYVVFRKIRCRQCVNRRG